MKDTDKITLTVGQIKKLVKEETQLNEVAYRPPALNMRLLKGLSTKERAILLEEINRDYDSWMRNNVYRMLKNNISEIKKYIFEYVKKEFQRKIDRFENPKYTLSMFKDPDKANMNKNILNLSEENLDAFLDNFLKRMEYVLLEGTSYGMDYDEMRKYAKSDVL